MYRRFVAVNPPAEVGGEPARKLLQHRLPIRGAFSSALFMLDDQPPNLPVRLHHRDVNRSIGGRARLFQHRANLAVESGDGRGEGASLLRHQTPSVSNISRWKSPR